MSIAAGGVCRGVQTNTCEEHDDGANNNRMWVGRQCVLPITRRYCPRHSSTRHAQAQSTEAGVKARRSAGAAGGRARELSGGGLQVVSLPVPLRRGQFVLQYGSICLHANFARRACIYT